MLNQLIIQHAPDYVLVDHRNIDLQTITAFFTPFPSNGAAFPMSSYLILMD
ncbi:hypothetical protein [Paraflavitalea speifideaquila]|uniref:hypothetical protein n=1 Tax=Paraflavitalea speifideaquila TaxID=3076558 RepID=UPI0028ECD13E|nr:hypothetical protein [Paraflavitalea speifideiaquila]